MSQPYIIAHRGNTHRRPRPPGNTIAAFTQAIALGADMVEFDVRRTRDQVLIIHHDPKIAGIPIEQASWITIQALNPQIPTLASVIQHCQNRIKLDVEIKTIGDEPAIVELLLTQLSYDDFVITSFNLKSLQTIKHHDPQITIGLLLKQHWRDRLRSRQNPQHHHIATQRLKAQIADLQPNFLAPQLKLLHTPWLQIINPTQIPYWVWTVNQPHQIQAMRHHPAISGIITDNIQGAIGLTQKTKNSH
jgi:glycerophosphoryl diester phosphodiesterase